MIASHTDVLAAYDAGRFHSQRFIKTGAGQANDTRWQDWAFQAGQPAYDARIGVAGSFTPVTAVRNDALYFPDIPAGMERKLHRLFINPKASNASQATVDFVLYDLVGYYPLIDGDSTDTQEFDNTLTLPRYTDGEGVGLVIVNHVAPAVQGGVATIAYTDSKGVAQSVTVGPSGPRMMVFGRASCSASIRTASMFCASSASVCCGCSSCALFICATRIFVELSISIL